MDDLCQLYDGLYPSGTGNKTAPFPPVVLTVLASECQAHYNIQQSVLFE